MLISLRVVDCFQVVVMKRPKITKKAVTKVIIGSSGLIANIAQRLFKAHVKMSDLHRFSI